MNLARLPRGSFLLLCLSAVASQAAPSLVMEHGNASITYPIGAGSPTRFDFDATGGMVTAFHTFVTRTERDGSQRWRIDLHDIPAPGANAYPIVEQIVLLGDGRVLLVADDFSASSTTVLAPNAWATTLFAGDNAAIVWLDPTSGSLIPGTAAPGTPKGLAVASDGTIYYSYIDTASITCRLSRFDPDLEVRLSDRALPVPNDWCGKVVPDASAPDRFIAFGRTTDSSLITSDGRGLLGAGDALIVRGGADGAGPTWTGRIGGTGDEKADGVISLPDGSLIVCGTTLGGDLVGSPDSHQSTRRGAMDAWVAKLDGAGTSEWLTFFGGGGSDECSALARSASGRLVLAGLTSSDDLPTTGSSLAQFSKAINGVDAFLAEVSGDGRELVYATYLGGGLTNPRGFTPETVVSQIEFINASELMVGGRTSATDIPVSSDGSNFVPNIGGSFQMRFDSPAVHQTSEPSLPMLWIGSEYSTTLTAQGSGPFDFQLVFGTIPAGLVLDSDGTLSGSIDSFPVAEYAEYGIPVFGVQVVDAAGNRDIRTYYLPWDSVSAPTILSSSFTGHALTQPLNVPLVWVFINTDPRAPMDWFLSGDVPPGISLQLRPDPAEARLVGAPTASGVYAFALNVTDRQGNSASYPLTVTVPSLEPPPTDDGGGGGGGTSDPIVLLLTCLCALGRRMWTRRRCACVERSWHRARFDQAGRCGR